MNKLAKASVVFLILMLLAPLSGALAQTTNPTSNIQTITKSIKDWDNRGWRGQTSLVFDSNNYPHLSYDEAPYMIGNSIKYESWNGSNWNIQNVDYTGELYPTSLALDSENNPHMVYGNFEHALNYASWNGTGWDSQVVDSFNYDSGYSLALDSNNNPQICFVSENYSLIYARWTGSNWEKQIISQQGGRNSLVLDAENNPHISYYFQDGYIYSALIYASWTGSNWTQQTVDTGNFGASPSLALDANGEPHISYLGNTGLKYATLKNTNWTTQFIESINLDAISHSDSIYTYSSCSLALDLNGNPHVSYSIWDNNNNLYLKYASLTNSSWNVQLADKDSGYDCSLAFDLTGKPHLCYIDLITGNVKYSSLEASTSIAKETQSNNGNIFATVVGVIVVVVVLAVLLLQRKRRVKKSSINLGQIPD
jgi:hypothetical protein